MKTKTITLGICLSLLTTVYSFTEHKIIPVYSEKIPKELSLKQNKKIQFHSDYQLDKTYNGSRKESRRKATIIMNDPKPLTKPNMGFDNLPKGFIMIKYEGLNPINNEIIYIGKNKSGADIYSITKTEQDYDVLYIIREPHKVGTKNYSCTILLGKSDASNLGGLPLYFTAFHSNIKGNN
ncbi:hypothetical protein [Chryseobacterium rhizosphaerae]|uniref:hypothetical protein n=1 Tax=Chryseobacterium rhizosphaerae TaxID=395937 RepID=UPI0023590071|nr:hypothetical protein [Chryseobacterium rhizosphaerae]MDC8099156.1 hypothetical protein [Chryseobacterium rhizosphaerae]